MTATPTSVPDAARASRLRCAVADCHAQLERNVRVMLFRAISASPTDIDEVIGDVLGETIRRALQSEDRYDGRPNPLPWLMAIALRVVQDQLRAHYRHDRRARPLSDDLPAPEAAIDPRCEDVARALAQLPDEQRKILLLRYADDLDGAKLAAAIGAPTAGAARVRLHRARMALAQILPTGEGDEP